MLWSIEDLDQNIYEQVAKELELDPLETQTLTIVQNMDVADVFEKYCESVGWDLDHALSVIDTFNNICEAAKVPEN